jgi:hypothetical protein
MQPDPTEHELFQLTFEQSFALEKYSRIIDETDDIDTLKRVAKLMLESYQRQRAATQWLMKKHLDAQWDKPLNYRSV